MKDFTDIEIAAYSARTIKSRDLIYVQPRDLTSGVKTNFGFWNGIGNVSLSVIDGLSGSTVSRSFVGKGAVLSIGDIPASDSLSVTAVDVGLNQLEGDVANALRGYDMRYAPCQIYRAVYDMANQGTLIAAARCRFVGFVNQCSITTPSEGGAASASFSLVGCTNELSRTNTALRSDESQRQRNASDSMFQFVNATGQVQVFWGEGDSTDTTTTPTNVTAGRQIYA